MSSGSIRIIQLPEKSSVNTDDYMAVDSSANGTKKIKFTDLLDDNLSVQNKAADAQATGEAISNVSARVDNMINTQQNASVTTLWTGTLENYNQQVTLSEDVSHFDYIDIYISQLDYQFIRRPVASLGNPIQIQATNLLDDGDPSLIQFWEGAVNISGTTAKITKANLINVHGGATYQSPTAQTNVDIPQITRIDGVKIGHTDNDEVVDARVGANGTIYPTLGDAIRGQVTDLKADLSLTDGIIGFTPITPDYGFKIRNITASTGAYDSSSTRIASNHIPVTKGSTISFSDSTAQYVLYFYTTNNVYINKGTPSWTRSSYTFDDDYYVVIVMRKDTSNSSINSGDVSTLASYISIKNATMRESIGTLETATDSNEKSKELYVEVSQKNLYRGEWLNGYPTAQSSPTALTDSNSLDSRCVYIKCEPSTTYTVSKVVSARFAVMWSKEKPKVGALMYGQIRSNSSDAITITTGVDAEYLIAWVYVDSYDSVSFDTINKTIQIETGSSATAFQTAFCAIDYTARKLLADGVYLPSYWVTYFANKLAELRTADANLGRNGVSFAFITDVHVRTNNMVSPKLLEYITRNTNVRKVVFGGDLITDYNTKSVAVGELYDWTRATSKLDIVNLHGNHDNNSNNQTDSTQILTDGEFYALECKQSEDYVVWDSGKLYGYRDNENQKVRFIYLDTGAPDSAVISDAQISWMQARITELGSGWTVIVFAHQFWTGANKATPTLTLDACGTKIMNGLDAIYDTIDATIACVIVGHCHRDYSMTSVKGYPIIATTCDASGTNASTYDPDQQTRTAGTTTEQCFDLYYVNTSDKTIKTIRIGAGDTTQNRSFSY